MQPGSFDVDKQLRGWLSKGLAKYCSRMNKSRHVVAGELGEALDWEISKSMLDAWTAESKQQNRIPALIIPAICVLFNDYKGMQIMAACARGTFLESRDAIYAEIARLEADRDQAEKLINGLKTRAKAMN